MTDPKWRLRVFPVMREAVECFSHLLASSKALLDLLLSKELLTPTEYQKTLTDLRSSSPEDVSRWLLVDALSRCPPGSFDTFCSLLPKVDRGQMLYDCLVRSNELQPHSEIDPNESQSLGHDRAPPTGLQTQCPETAFKENDQPVAQSTSASDPSVDRCDAVVILVDVSIKEDYEKHHDAFSAVIDIFIMLTVGGEKNYPIIKRFVSAMELTSERYHVLVAKECYLKIIFPRTQLETFENQRTSILRKLESMTNVDIKKVEVIQGSCHVILILTAAGFIRFVCCLLSPESLWQLLSSVDNLVEIQLGNLLPVKLSRIEKFARDFGKLTRAKASLSHFSEYDIRQRVDFSKAAVAVIDTEIAPHKVSVACQVDLKELENHERTLASQVAPRTVSVGSQVAPLTASVESQVELPRKVSVACQVDLAPRTVSVGSQVEPPRKVAPRKVSVGLQVDIKEPETRQGTTLKNNEEGIWRRIDDTLFDMTSLDFDLDLDMIDITVGYSDKSTKRLGEKDVLKVTLRNNGEVTIPEQRIILRQNEYYQHAVAVMPEVAPHKEVSVELEVDVKKPGTRRITDLCQSFDIHFQGFDETITTKTKIANYNQGLGHYCPQTLLERAGKDPYEMKCYNILLFGVSGASKSSFINTLLTMLQDEDKQALSRVCVEKEDDNYATQMIIRYDVKAVHPYLHFSLWDTRGSDENNYDTYLVGLKGTLPPNWSMHFDLEKHADTFDKLLKKETLLTQMHAVFFFVPQESLTDLDTDKMARVCQVFEYIRQEGYNPLVILCKVDEVVQEVRDDPFHPFEEIEKMRHRATELFQIDLCRVLYTVNYLHETSRNWKIEALAHQNLTAALDACESFVKNRLMRFGRVSKKGAHN